MTYRPECGGRRGSSHGRAFRPAIRRTIVDFAGAGRTEQGDDAVRAGERGIEAEAGHVKARNRRQSFEAHLALGRAPREILDTTRAPKDKVTATKESRKAPASPPESALYRSRWRPDGLRSSPGMFGDEGDRRTPNCPAAPGENSMAPATMPGSDSGSVTVGIPTAAKLRGRGRCSVRSSIASMARRMARIMSGNSITAAASAAPVQRNENTMPK